jgi:hypothetical protein
MGLTMAVLTARLRLVTRLPASALRDVIRIVQPGFLHPTGLPSVC